jgi:hypothetical protein
MDGKGASYACSTLGKLTELAFKHKSVRYPYSESNRKYAESLPPGDLHTVPARVKKKRKGGKKIRQGPPPFCLIERSNPLKLFCSNFRALICFHLIWGVPIKAVL